MKKIYFLLLTLLISTMSFGQASNLYFSMYGEGSSNNKWLEIYNGTGADIDLVDYSVELYPNGAATANNTLTFTAGTILPSGDVYVIYNASANAAISANGDIESTVTFFNGDDAVALLQSGVVIDVIGQIGVDPGTAWNVGSTTNGTVNYTLVRKSEICDPNPTGLGSFGTDDATSEWIVYAIDTEWGQIGSHTGCSTAPSITISSPANAAVLAPGTSNVDVVFNTANTAGTETVDITINGTTFNDVASPYSIATTNGTTYDVTVELIDGSVIDSDMVSFSVATPTSVDDLAALRADFIANGPGAYYELQSTPTVTYTRTTRNQKYIQDASAGILIDDASGTIATSFSIGDGMSGLIGTASEFNGVLQFIPLQDATVTAGAAVTPAVVTVATLLTDWENYESQLVRINNATFADAGGTFANATDYDLSDGSVINFRTNFSEADYIDQAIPAGANPVVGLISEFGGNPQITSRSLSDVTLGVASFERNKFSVYPNPTSLGYVNITSNNADDMSVKVFDVLGKQVLNQTVSNNRLNVSSLNSGVYIIKISQNNATITKKLVVK